MMIFLITSATTFPFVARNPGQLVHHVDIVFLLDQAPSLHPRMPPRAFIEGERIVDLAFLATPVKVYQD